MASKFKGIVYLLNDLTNSLLGKERSKIEDELKFWQAMFFVVTVILLVSLGLNVYFWINV